MDASGTYSELLEILYAAPLEDSQWERFLDRLCKVTGSIVALFVRNDSAQGIRRLALGAVKAPMEVLSLHRSGPAGVPAAAAGWVH
jgi:hypothetical protein